MKFSEATHRSRLVRHPEWEDGTWLEYDYEEKLLFSTKTGAISGAPDDAHEGWEANG